MSRSSAPPPKPRPAKMEAVALGAAFREAVALKRVTMPVVENRVTAVIGPSGCGKSTFIRCLNRMHEVVPGATRTGEVLLDGESIYGPEVDPVSVRRRVGMVFQKPNPFPDMSVRDNVLSGLRLNGIRPANADSVVEAALSQAALWSEMKDGLGRTAGGLSGGQQQRLCIARCLALEPEVILMDEPCSSLDPIATARIEELIHELSDRYTIVIVTHSMQQAARVSDYTAFFYLGEVVEYGLADVLFTRPEDPRTEEYITGRFG
ncbi:MAG: phosphate ABC transporter ATP-binding protein [Myxococcales bacterium]|mgnify:CR=1 FL=1|jgi:phosphate transport system ATP-binding protein|nr:phosphate ABC transporter ATP-binding protein [Myxococcales bacterium]MBL0195766.1 phosphate ABC transporter ATP-binding protein [Myxococcales bacterium]